MERAEKSQGQETVTRSSRGEGRTVRILTGRSEWKLTPAQTGGHYCMMESLIPPGGGVPPHQHADQEAFYVLEGTLDVGRTGPAGLEWFLVKAGDLINVPGDQLHAFRNTSVAPARVLMTATPGLVAFFEEVGTPIVPGSPEPSGPPSTSDVERLFEIARKHGHHFVQGRDGAKDRA